jgi:predicted O-methyltransferase YrrM
MQWKRAVEGTLNGVNRLLRPTRVQFGWYTGRDLAELERLGASDHLGYRDAQVALGIAAPGHVTLKEGRFLADLARQSDPSGPMIEIGTLFGFSTLILALSKTPGQRLYTVDNYCWNPLGLSPGAHIAATRAVLREAIAQDDVVLVARDKEAFYREYDGPPPSLFFCDADHSYAATRRDLEWARSVGAQIICGHDYDRTREPGVVQAVEEAGGPRAVVGSLFVI